MRTLLFTLLVLAVPTVALAQTPVTEDQTERPSAAVCEVRFTSDNLGADLQICIINDVTQFLNPLFHTECRDHNGPTFHPIFVPAGSGSVTVWGVVTRTPSGSASSVSNPSQFSKTCEDVPFMPFQITGHPPLEDSLG